MIRAVSRTFTLTLATVLLTVICLPQPAAAQYDAKYMPVAGTVQSGGGELGRSMGGAAGMAIGGIGGAAIFAAIMKAAPALATLGPLATVLLSTCIVGATIFLGSKLFSTLGQSLERSMGAKNMWTMIGAALGAVAAIAFLGSAGIFAGPAGLLLKAVIGGLAGGTLARLFSGKLEFLANPRILYPIMGGLMMAVGGAGIPGAIAGVAFGFVAGMIMDNVYAADRNRSLGSYVGQGMGTAESWVDKFKNWTSGIKNWISGKTDGVQNYVRNNWDDDYNNRYYGQYSDAGYNAGYNYGYNNQYSANSLNYNTSYGNNNLNSGYNNYRNAYQNFLDLNNSGAPIEQRQRALESARQSYLNYSSSLPYGSSYNSSYGSYGY